MPNITSNRVLFAYSFRQVQPKSIKFFYGINPIIMTFNLLSRSKLNGNGKSFKLSDPKGGTIHFQKMKNYPYEYKGFFLPILKVLQFQHV